MNGFKSMKVNVSSGVAGLSNRGAANAGLYIVGGELYEGYFFAATATSSTITVEASLYNYGPVESPSLSNRESAREHWLGVGAPPHCTLSGRQPATFYLC